MQTAKTNFLITRAQDYLALRAAGLEAIHTGLHLRSLLGEAASALNCHELETAARAILAAL